MALQLMKIRNPPSQTTTIFQFQFEQIMVQMVQIRCISYSRSVHATTITGKSADWQPSMTRANHRRPVLKRLAGRCCVKAYQWKPGWEKKIWHGGKVSTSRDGRSFERTVRITPSQKVGDLHKEWTEAGVSASGAALTSVQSLVRSFSHEIFFVSFRNQVPRLLKKTF